MTRDAEAPEKDVPPDQRAETPAIGPYQAPELIPLGNVHVLLAGNGVTPVKDSNHLGMRS